MVRVFISYRRSDSAVWAGRIRDHLVQHLGRRAVFLDVEDIAGGERFTEAIAQQIANANVVVVVVIGPAWLSDRLQREDDSVHTEIALALRSNTRILPVLVAGAQMPSSDSLPPDLAKLAEINAIEISANRFARDAEQLTKLLPKSLGRLIARIGLLLIALSAVSYTIYRVTHPTPLDVAGIPIQGVVTDSKGHPVENAEVTIDGTQFQATTNQDGYFLRRLPHVSPDSILTVHVRHLDKKKDFPLRVGSLRGDTDTLHITLDPR